MNSEFSVLSDLAVGKGIKHSQLLSAIHKEVSSEYQARYPDREQPSVLVDETSGEVKLFLGTREITPDEFRPVARDVARKTVVHLLSHLPTIPEKRMFSQSGWLTKFLFWSYNGMYAVFVLVYLLHFLDSSFRQNLWEGAKNVGFFKSLLFLLFFLTPILSIISAFKSKVVRTHLAKFFFVLEVPIITVIFLALNVFRDQNSAMWFFILMLVFTPIMYFLSLLKYKPASKRGFIIFILVQLWVILTSTYIGLLLLFYLPLIVSTVYVGFFGEFLGDVFFAFGRNGLDFYMSNLLWALFVLTLALIAITFLTVLLSLPYIVTYLMVKICRRTEEEALKYISSIQIHRLYVYGVLAFIATVLVLSYQPNIGPYITKLTQLSSLTIYDEQEGLAKELIPHEKEIKQGLEDMLYARSRYLFIKDDTHLKDGYEEILNFDPVIASVINDTFLTLAHPFVYRQQNSSYSNANSMYEYIFGTSPYNKSTPRQTEVANVKLVSRTTSATTDYDGMIATISFEEEFTNKTNWNQEVIYEFSLASDAVISELKLGPNLEFAGLIAPRGAAQKTYQQELNRSRDPALLEQTGPRQYRLRVFPIPPKTDPLLIGGKNQKVRFTYRVLADALGYALPVFSKKQNLDEASHTKTITINTIPASVTTSGSTSFIKPDVNTFDLCSIRTIYSSRTNYLGQTVKLVPHQANPLLTDSYECSKTIVPTKLITSLSDKKIALLIDASYSNKHNPFVKQFRELVKVYPTLVSQNTVNLYLYNDKLSSPRSLTGDSLTQLEGITYFGKNNWYEVIATLNGDYDFAIVVVGNNVTLSRDTATQSDTTTISLNFPFYIYHLNGELPSYPSQVMNALTQSGGNSYTSLKDIFTDVVLRDILVTTDSKVYRPLSLYGSIMVDDKREVSLETDTTSLSPSPPVSNLATNSSDPLSFIYARAFIYDLIAQYPGAFEKNLTFLDSVHDLAKKTHIVTPFSSLIALVNAQQIENLEEFSDQSDRYEDTSRLSESQIPPPMNFPMGSLDFVGGLAFSRQSPSVMMDGGGELGIVPTASIGNVLQFVPFLLVNGLIISIGVIVVFVRAVRHRRQNLKKI